MRETNSDKLLDLYSRRGCLWAYITVVSIPLMALSIAGFFELLEKEFDWALFILSVFIASLSIAVPASFIRYRVIVTDDYVEVIQMPKWFTKRVYFRDVTKLRLYDGTLYIFATSGKASVFYAIEQYERVIQTVVDKVKQNPGIEYDFSKHELAEYVCPNGKGDIIS